MTVLRPDELERWGGPEGAQHPRGAHHSLGIVYIYPRPELRNETGKKVLRPLEPGHVRLSGALGGPILCDPRRLRYEARRILDAADTLEAMQRPELHPDASLDVAEPEEPVVDLMAALEQSVERAKADRLTVTLPNLEEAGFRDAAAFYYAARLVGAQGLDLEEARARLKEARTVLGPRQWNYVLERLDPPRYLCAPCDRVLPMAERYGTPDAPRCSECYLEEDRSS